MLDLAPCLPYLDVMFINEDEARMNGASPQVLLEGGARIAVMKLGNRGCAIYTGDREYLCPAFEVEARDTTGAGDCFVAGFLAAMLRGANLPEAGHFANAVAALSIRASDARTPNSDRTSPRSPTALLNARPSAAAASGCGCCCRGRLTASRGLTEIHPHRSAALRAPLSTAWHSRTDDTDSDRHLCGAHRLSHLCS